MIRIQLPNRPASFPNAVAAVISLLYLMPTGVVAGEGTGPEATMSAIECEVFRRELSFADSVERHDAVAFSAHLLPGAVFDVGTITPIRGADAIKEAWADIISGKVFLLKWRPQLALVGSDPDLAITHGPYLIRQTSADGSAAYFSGRFSSVWKRMPDGQWYALFDGGGEPPRPIGAVEAEAIFDGLPKVCEATNG